MLRHHGDAARRLDHVDHAGDRQRLGAVEGPQGRAEQRRMDHDRRQHAGQPDIDGVVLGAGDLRLAVKARQVLVADQRPVRAVLERDLGRDGHRCRRLGQLPEGGALSRGVADHTLRHRDLGGGDAPRLGRGRDQHRLGSGAGAAIAIEGGGHGRGAAGPLKHPAPHEVAVQRGVAGSALDVDLGPVGVEFLGDQRGDAVVDALAHLEMGRQHGHPVVGADADIAGERVRGLLCCRAFRGAIGGAGAAADKAEADDEAGAGRHRSDQELAARRLGGGLLQDFGQDL